MALHPAPGIILALVFGGALAFVLVAIARSLRPELGAARRLPARALGAGLCLAFLALGSAYFAWRWSSSVLDHSTSHEASDAALRVETRLGELERDAGASAAYVSSLLLRERLGDPADEGRLARVFEGAALRHGELRALLFARRVAPTERQAWSARHAPIRGREGEEAASRFEGLAYPVEHVHPPALGPNLIGLDVNATSERAALVAEAAELGLPRASSLYRHRDGFPASWLVHPVRDGLAEGSAPPAGLVVFVVDLERLVASALAEDADDYHVQLAAEDEAGLLRATTRPADAASRFEDEGARAHRHALSFGGRAFVLRMLPAEEERLLALVLVPFLMLELGLLLALLVAWRLVESELAQQRLAELVRRQDQEIAESERGFASLVDATPDPVLVVAPSNHRVIDANEAMATLLKTTIDALKTRSLGELLVLDEGQSASSVISRALEPSSAGGCYVDFRRSDHRRVEADLFGASIVAGGEPTHVLFARDVSVLERARRASEAAARARRSFLASFGHGVRTPLNAILGIAGLAADEELPPSAREQVQAIERCARDLLVVIEDALDYAGLEAANPVVSETLFDPRRLVENVASHLAPRARAKQLALVDRVRRDVRTPLLSDASRIERALVTLAGNAIRRAESGYVEICVFPAGEIVAGIQNVVVAVRDTGSRARGGDEERLLEQVLGRPRTEPLEAEERPLDLGVTLAAQLVETLGGRVEVEAAGDYGAELRMTVPLKLAEGATLPSPRDELLGRLALIVHPLAPVRDALREKLLTLGVRAIAAPGLADARDATRRLAGQDQRAELLLVDVGLLDDPLGAATLADDIAPRTPTLGVSARPRSAWPPTCREGLVLPFGEDALVRALERALGLVEETKPNAGREARGRVLVVEDSAVNRRLAEAILEREGFDVLVAEEGERALAVLREEAVDLVLMDVQMPVLDGLEATRRLRATPGLAALPVVAMTASAQREDYERCLEAGMNDLLAKPFEREDLIETARRWCASGGEASAPLPSAESEEETLAVGALLAAEDAGGD